MTLPRTQAILMYHAIGSTALDPRFADPHYTVTTENFREQLELIVQAGLTARSVAETLGEVPESNDNSGRVCITFDDGHDTNFVAAQMLHGYEMTADFFVNPSTIGTTGFLTWSQLGEMQRMGMSIQSHGMTHRYMDELDDATLQAELTRSKIAIEDSLGVEVSLLAPPGGRMSKGLAQQSRQVGYSAICNSIAGYWEQTQEMPVHSSQQLPRIAVLNATGASQYQRWLLTDTVELNRMTRRYRLLQLAKQAMGNRTYDAVRAVAVRVMS